MFIVQLASFSEPYAVVVVEGPGGEVSGGEEHEYGGEPTVGQHSVVHGYRIEKSHFFYVVGTRQNFHLAVVM